MPFKKGNISWNKGLTKEIDKRLIYGNKIIQYYYCIEKECNNKVSKKSNKCNLCANKGENNPMFGKKHSEETKQKIGLSNSGKNNFWYGKKNPEHSERMQGKANPAWNNGSSFESYPIGWTNTFKEQIRYRDQYKCQLCGCHEVECEEKLHVHHTDYNKNNLDVNNLISLCRSCHQKTNFDRGKWETLFKNKKQVYNV